VSETIKDAENPRKTTLPILGLVLILFCDIYFGKNRMFFYVETPQNLFLCFRKIFNIDVFKKSVTKGNVVHVLTTKSKRKRALESRQDEIAVCL
jgi:hypothetical protein